MFMIKRAVVPLYAERKENKTLNAVNKVMINNTKDKIKNAFWQKPAFSESVKWAGALTVIVPFQLR